VTGSSSKTNKWLLRFGVLLVLGGLAHTAGVLRLYLRTGVPEANRVLLDVWIAEAQIAAGVLFATAARSPEARPWTIAGAVVVWSYAVPFVPVLLRRAPAIFWVAPILYTLVSAALVRVVALRRSRSRTTVV
jgi:hypothetical protein